MADQAQFEALMRALMSEKNEERKAAEAQFEGLVRTPPQAAPLMCTAMVTSADLTVRSMTTIMFRKRVDEAFYKALPPDMQASGPSPLLAKAQCHDNLIQNNLIESAHAELGRSVFELLLYRTVGIEESIKQHCAECKRSYINTYIHACMHAYTHTHMWNRRQ